MPLLFPLGSFLEFENSQCISMWVSPLTTAGHTLPSLQGNLHRPPEAPDSLAVKQPGSGRKGAGTGPGATAGGHALLCSPGVWKGNSKQEGGRYF